MNFPKNIVLGLAALGTLAACEGVVKPYLRDDVTDRLGHAAWMVERDISAGLFTLRVYERMHERNAPATIYIEGDGELTSDFNIDSKNPTPRNPVSLHLATRDKSENLVWMARPCQYTGIEECDAAYWGNERFSPEVLSAYNIALDDIKARWNLTTLNLVGFDGGGAIAAILATQRNDVVGFRTVAANLNTDVYAAEHGIPPLAGSLNPVNFAPELAQVPQIHYIGGQDKVISPALLHSYLQAVGPSNCVQYRFIQEAEHDQGWVDKWPELLLENPVCVGVVEQFEEFEPMPEPVRIQPETPDKK